MAPSRRARVLTYGLDPGADLWADEIESQGLARRAIHPASPQRGLRIRLPLLGVHSVHTALRAASVAVAVGMNWRDILDGLQTGEQQQLRLIVVAGVNNTTIIDDSYNANPASSLAALNLLSEMPAPARRRAGRYAGTGRLRAGRAHQSGPPGRRRGRPPGGRRAAGAHHRRRGAALRAWTADRVFFAATNAQAIDHLRRVLAPGSYVLIKGSHGMHMEEIVEGLRAPHDAMPAGLDLRGAGRG